MARTPDGPILNRPRKAPEWHFWWNEQGNRTADRSVAMGRIPANGKLPTMMEYPRRNIIPLKMASKGASLSLLETVYEVREEVAQWQKDEFQGATMTTKDLMVH